MRILRSSQHRLMPWKNGGGETLEVALFPAGASLDDFGWRVSMAKVAASGPFSRFTGTDRVLAVLEGEMKLSVAGQADVLLSAQSPAHRFAGDAAAHAELISTVTDLNVMVRREAFSADVRRLDAAQVTAGPGETFVLIRSDARLSTGEALAHNDVLQLAPTETITFATVPANAWLIRLTPLAFE